MCVEQVRSALVPADEEAERFMLLASATNTIVWPLYSVGMSSLCTPVMRAYVDRLMAIFHETGLKQAETIVAIVRISIGSG